LSYIMDRMLLPTGHRLGPYEILSPLGAGGMGEVYKARDTRLDRLVAVKIATAHLTDRFAQEARAVAALSHPNIVALYDVGENYIVTELIDGESLRTAQFTPRQAIEIAAQVAVGLAAAHSASIAHRDLKPENVIVTRDGRAKIVDFGLSRQYAGASSAESTRTLPGTVMGTVGYMSPEQVRGQEADHRSDIFSFGAMLYEMLSGKRAFTAETSAEIMTAILNQDPPDLPASVPPACAAIVRHCLEKEPDARFQSAKDLSFALRSTLVQSTASSAVAAIPTAWPRRWTAPVAIAAALIAAFAAGWLVKRTPHEGLADYRFTPLASEAGRKADPAWSPDGKTIAYAANVGPFTQIFTRRLNSPVPDQITHDQGQCRFPVWSPKGDRIYYTLSRRGAPQIWSIAAIGGAAQKELDGVSFIAIAPDGKSIAAAFPRDGFAFGTFDGGALTPYRKPPFDQGFAARSLQFSPDGTKLAALFTRINSTEGEIWLVPYPQERGSPHKLFDAEPKSTTFSGLGWMPDSRNLAVTVSRTDEPAQLYLGDSETGKLRRLTAGMEHRGSPAVSPDGRRIAFTQQAETADVVEITLDGVIRPVVNTTRAETSAAWLPKGREFVYSSNANGPFDLWVRNPEDNHPRQFLPGGHDILPPGRIGEIAVAPDGERVSFVAWSSEHTIWVLRPTGGKAVRIDAGNPDHHSPAWSPDGNWITYARVLPKVQLMKAPAGGGTPIVLATSEAALGPTQVAWSPTGDSIAWAADELALYSPDGKLQKRLGDRHPRQNVAFSPDGKTLYVYYAQPGTAPWSIEAIDIATGKTRRLGTFEFEGNLHDMHLHPGGMRFLASLELINPDIVLLEGF
jgi:Tol biopolymer transport system component/predicted Ser/Thr protein kinase